MALLHRIAALAALTTALSLVVSAQQRPLTTVATSLGPDVTTDVLRRTGTDKDSLPGAWLSYGRTQGETRFSPLSQINATNAKNLGLAWSYVMGAGGDNQEGTPLVWNNTLYGWS